MEAKRVVITGVSRGLGRALVEGLAAAGCVVAGCARSADQIQRLSASYPPPHRFDLVDVSQNDQVRDWAGRVLDAQGPPDLLLNNAALINDNAPLWEVPVEQFAQVVDVNIKGVFLVIRHFLPAMIRRGSGVIVNFSSGWGRSTSASVAPYCATKWAIEGLTRALAEELPPGLAAIPLNPGIIHTQMLESCFGPHASSYPNPRQWAERVVPFLLDLSAADNGDPLTAPS
ncbi:MAG: SDR family oxidoreductase [Pirellulaceae bacterium]|nr:SDR family oxidoreductase [Pirellulaceae bacterium]